MTDKQVPKRIIISRPDAIGDVILTLPMCGVIKKHFPNAHIIFLGRTYTQAVIACCEHVDEFINADELLKLSDNKAIELLQKTNADTIIHVLPHKHIAILAKKASIKNRIGTRNRAFHWLTVNKLVRLSRKNSELHESQLNCKLLNAIGIDKTPSLPEMAGFTGFSNIPVSQSNVLELIDKTKTTIILHPKSNASAREWGLANFKALTELLPTDRYRIFISGTAKEQQLLAEWMKTLNNEVIDITGKLSLEDFIAFIHKADYLVAASTGPLHIAAASGTHAVGIYPPIRPMHPGRWQPIGKHVDVACVNRSCSDCRKNPHQCHCMNDITPQQIAAIIRQNEK